MKINLIAVGQRLPKWVNEGFRDYTKRLSQELTLNLIEVAALKRTQNANLTKIIEEESQRLLDHAPPHTDIITLDRRGHEYDTETLAKVLAQYHTEGRHLSLLIGGPEGLSNACLQKTSASWSLSKLTLPHALVRVVIAEQIYRAWSIMAHHPYHR